MTRKVLIVDDDPRNRKLVETLLRNDGCEVRTAASGQTALAAVARELPDLIVLDLMMPGMDGFEVVRRLKVDAAWQRVPVIMLTALDDGASLTRLAAAGVAEVMTKPVDRWELKARIDRLLGSPSAGGEDDTT